MAKSIPKRFKFFGRVLVITVTSQASVINQWIRTVRYFKRRHPLVVGVGVQWTPVRFEPDPLPDVLHLCVGNRCLIIQLNHCKRLPDVLRSFLADREITFVGVWNSQDKGKLARCSHRLEIWRLLDVRLYLAASLKNCSFEKIVEECFGYEGVRLDKEISTSDWGVCVLSNDQILQAAKDSFFCFKLGVKQCLWQV
ncbi:hypothetical protein EUTSA_v10017696mg [Eutrema salsugineum]|uniref:3'-5' exonuclease domain-containing protein n=1 Tax=Eutrema salsugineum TaxID=72664 RepID=V4MAS8_EUTSA|nr:uncharacterized protein LOC18027954 [Eutrema salsugineum]ESQ52237.1 hypothetical protein EUTSA_v10017696mg [Eutrema salsugineum]